MQPGLSKGTRLAIILGAAGGVLACSHRSQLRCRCVDAAPLAVSCKGSRRGWSLAWAHSRAAHPLAAGVAKDMCLRMRAARRPRGVCVGHLSRSAAQQHRGPSWTASHPLDMERLELANHCHCCTGHQRGEQTTGDARGHPASVHTSWCCHCTASRVQYASDRHALSLCSLLLEVYTLCGTAYDMEEPRAPSA